MSNNLIQKFQNAEETFIEKSFADDSQETFLEEVVVWRSSCRLKPSFKDLVRSKVLEATGLASKNFQLDIRGEVNTDSLSFHSLRKLVTNYNFRQFLNGNKDLCNLSIVMNKTSMKVEGYRMFEVTSRLREKGVSEVLNRFKNSTAGKTKLIRRDYGKNEKSVNVVILGFSYQEQNKEKEKERKRQEI